MTGIHVVAGSHITATHHGLHMEARATTWFVLVTQEELQVIVIVQTVMKTDAQSASVLADIVFTITTHLFTLEITRALQKSMLMQFQERAVDIKSKTVASI